MGLTAEQAKTIGEMQDPLAEPWPSSRGCPTRARSPAPCTAPYIYHFYELIMGYGSTIDEPIHEAFGDGIMCAIDFSMDIARQPDPKGDRPKVVPNGKFLPCEMY